MKIELLYLDGCPNHETLLRRLRGLLERANVSSVVELCSKRSNVPLARDGTRG
jgi:hypothetical protein